MKQTGILYTIATLLICTLTSSPLFAEGMDARSGTPVYIEADSVTITIHVALVVNARGSTKTARILKTEVDPYDIDQIDKALLEELTAEAIHDAKRYPGIAPKNKKLAQVVVPIVFIIGAEEALISER